MCLKTKFKIQGSAQQTLKRQLRVAKEDIYVWKLMAVRRRWDKMGRRIMFHLMSRFQGAIYTPYKLYKTEIKPEEKTGFCGYLHIGPGFHSYINYERAIANWNFSMVTVLCIIPKGARYLKGNWNREIVSDSIIVTHVVYSLHSDSLL